MPEPVLVTTEGNGVFFGYLENYGDRFNAVLTIKNARSCVYWDTSVKGFLGLASFGPNERCRVGEAVPEVTLQKVMSVSLCSKQAKQNWEMGFWAK